MIDWLPNGLVRHLLPRPDGLIECETVVDIGAGLRPIDWYRAEHHVCVDPHPPYVHRLIAAGHTAVVGTAKQALQNLTPGAAIYMLDVIEHMERDDGLEVLALALATKPRQIVVYTPVGFIEQNGPDPWGLDGDRWQQHRSGWTPADFAGWSISYFHRGFIALWTAPTAN